MQELQANLKKDMAYVVVGVDGKTVGGLMRNSSKGSHVFIVDHRTLQLSEESSKVTIINTEWGLRELSSIISCKMLKCKLNQLCIIKNDEIIAENPDAYRNVDLFVERSAELFKISCNTLISFGKQFTTNLYKNIAHIAANPGINGLKNQFQIPAIIVSAGPSLDKNVHLLNGLKDKALIIACGSTMSALNHHGVVPHILLATDAAHDKDLNVPKETLLLCPYEGPAPVIARHDYKAFFRTFDCHIKGLPPTAVLKQNLSVSTAGVSLALFMGCTKIIWVDMVVQMYIMTPMRNALSGMLGGMFGGSSGGTVGPTMTYDSTGTYLVPRASGGPVSAGQMYKVNELGIETFVPSTNGFIMTAGQTKKALAGTSPNIQIQVVNQTGTPARARQQSSFDSETNTAVISIVLDALETDRGGLRTVVGGLRG